MRITEVDELTLEELTSMEDFYLVGGGGGGFDSEAEATEFVNSLLALDNYNLDYNLLDDQEEEEEDKAAAVQHIKKIKKTEGNHETVPYAAVAAAAESCKGKKNNYPKGGRAVQHWTKEEHIIFLKGVEEYGWGSWKQISENCLPGRTQYQLASHAQKYLLHHHQDRPATKKRRRCTSI